MYLACQQVSTTKLIRILLWSFYIIAVITFFIMSISYNLFNIAFPPQQHIFNHFESIKIIIILFKQDLPRLQNSAFIFYSLNDCRYDRCRHNNMLKHVRTVLLFNVKIQYLLTLKVNDTAFAEQYT